jgi:hypothetical protein
MFFSPTKQQPTQQHSLNIMDFDNMDFDKWNKNDLIELMNMEEFDRPRE